MAHITIEQTGSFDDTPNAVLRFDHGAPYTITITPPFSEAEEERLRWYFEDHLCFPFIRQVEAAEAAQSVVAYGETLFEQVFRRDPDIYAEYTTAVKQGLQDLHVDIIGQPSFHQLHWEALREPDRDPFVLHGRMIRRSQASIPYTIEAKPSSTINLLIVTLRS